jgi:hypothetical protein
MTFCANHQLHFKYILFNRINKGIIQMKNFVSMRMTLEETIEDAMLISRSLAEKLSGNIKIIRTVTILHPLSTSALYKKEII